MTTLEGLKNKVQKLADSEDLMDQANVVLQEMEGALQNFHRRVYVTIDQFLDEDGSHIVWLEYRRGDIHGQRNVWGLFIRDQVEEGGDEETTSWYWQNAPGTMRIKAAGCKEKFVEAAAEVADKVISELPQ